MNHEWEERDIRELFRDLRQEDERLAPSFARHWNPARSKAHASRRPGRPLRAIAAAAAALTALGVSAIIFRQPAIPPAADISTSRWRSPTDFLLQLPGESLLKAVPRLGESLTELRAIRPNTNGGAR